MRPRSPGLSVMRIGAIVLAGLCAGSAPSGCVFLNPKLPNGASANGDGTGGSGALDRANMGSLTAGIGGKVGPEQLDSLLQAYADRYAAIIGTAFESVKQDNTDRDQRRAADFYKAVSTTAMYDIATSQDPLTKFIDAVLVVTLQSRLWIDEDKAERLFGPDRAEPLIRAFRRAREDIWEIASKVMTPQQLQILDWLIYDWRRQNREVDVVSFVRFNDVGAARGKALVAEVKSGGGLLAPVDDAVQQIREAKLMTERAFYLSKRAPILLNWHSQALVSDLLTNPDVAGAVDAAMQANESLNKISKTVEAMPGMVAAEREAILKNLAERQAAVDATLANYTVAAGATTKAIESAGALAGQSRELLGSVQQTSDSLRMLVQSADSIMARVKDMQPPPGSDAAVAQGGAAGLDIEKVRGLATDVSGIVKDLNALVNSTGTLAASDMWKKRIEEVAGLADRRVETTATASRSVIDYIFWRAVMLTGVVLLAAVAYRVISGYLPGSRKEAVR